MSDDSDLWTARTVPGRADDPDGLRGRPVNDNGHVYPCPVCGAVVHKDDLKDVLRHRRARRRRTER
jgi:hypothetical protein